MSGHILRDFQDDPKTWASHAGDLIKVKNFRYSMAYELDCAPEHGRLPKNYNFQDGEIIMFLGQSVNDIAWRMNLDGLFNWSMQPAAALVFFSLRTHQKIGLIMRHFNIENLEGVYDDQTSET